MFLFTLNAHKIYQLTNVIKLVGFVEERSLEETLGQTDVSRSYKFDVDLVPDVQTLHQQTDAILGATSSFRVA